MSATPGTISSPASASFTRTAVCALQRSAKRRVNSRGMCCTITIPGASGGSSIRSSAIASVPPVEAPTATMAGASPADVPRVAGRARAGSGSDRNRAFAASFTFSMISSAAVASHVVMSPWGLQMKSTAPRSSAWSVTSQASAVMPEIITTGNGDTRMRWSRSVSPSTRGMTTSRVTTSGRSATTFRWAM
jgi:hypothetical protein